MENKENTNLFAENIKDHSISTEMKTSYLDYAMSVIKSRALPDVRDGLKPVHRRILFAMHKLGVTSGAKFVKSARIVGEVIGKYHPHGDTSVYDAMVRLAQPFSMRYPLIKGQGNFGSIDGDSAAAMRYTEAKMEKITTDLLADIEKETVKFQDNYDGSFREPSVLPSRLPMLLLNGSMGIAVGMATNIPPNNLREVCNAITYLLENKNCEVDEILNFIKGPDFPTKGQIFDQEAIKEAYKNGRGSIIMRGVAEIIMNEKTQREKIIISELPYQVNKANLVEKIANLVRDKSLEGINEIRDESSKGEIRVIIGLKKEAFGQKILNQIYKLTPLQSSFGVNMIALSDKGSQPKLLNVKKVLEEFIEHRFEVITNRTKYDLALNEARKHILDGLKKALDHIDEIIATIRMSKTKEDAKENLIEKFTFSDIQADAILAMRLSLLAGLERLKIEDELKLKIEIIADLKDILANSSRIDAIIKTETDEVSGKYGNDRKTKIISHGLGKFNAKDLVPNLDMIVTISKKGYIKRMPIETYSAQNRGGKGVKGAANEEDSIIEIFHAKNQEELLFFTDNGRCFKLSVYEIPQAGRTARGNALVNFLNLGDREQVSTVLNISQATGKYIIMTTSNGTTKKSELDHFQNVRRNGLIAAKVRPGELLKWVKITSGDDEVVIITKKGKSIRFSEKDIRSMGRTASGVRGIRLKDGDEVIEMDTLASTEGTTLLTIMENGLSKMTDINLYRLQSRGGSGVKVANLTPKTGDVVGAKIINENMKKDILLMSTSGITIRQSANDIPQKGRSTQGVIIMRMKKEGDKVNSVSLIPREEEVEEEILEEKGAGKGKDNEQETLI